LVSGLWWQENRIDIDPNFTYGALADDPLIRPDQGAFEERETLRRSTFLDTNVCIRYLNGRSPNIRRQLYERRPIDIVVCSVVKCELFYGTGRSHEPERSLAVQRRLLRPFRSLPFDDKAAEVAGLLRTHLAAQGRPIGPYD